MCFFPCKTRRQGPLFKIRKSGKGIVVSVWERAFSWLDADFLSFLGHIPCNNQMGKAGMGWHCRRDKYNSAWQRKRRKEKLMGRPFSIEKTNLQKIYSIVAFFLKKAGKLGFVAPWFFSWHGQQFGVQRLYCRQTLCQFLRRVRLGPDLHLAIPHCPKEKNSFVADS